MRFTLSGLCLALVLGLVLPETGCGKKRRGGDTTTEAAQTTPTKPVTTPAPQPAATKPEPGPNVNLSALGRFWTEQEVKNHLRNLGLAYQNYVSTTGKGPPDRKGLSSYYENNAQINEVLDKGWFKFAWKVTPQQMPNGPANTILAYEPDADGRGNRWVLMGDGSVHSMARDQFEKTPKAGK
jgi:hypothetical protein